VKRLKVGIVGLGSWGECHLQAYRDLPHVEVVAVCDEREERLALAAERYGVPRRYRDAEALLAEEGIELVSIVTYEKEHLAPTLAALASGKHALVEKPVATDVSEAKRMLEAARAANRRLFPGHLLRFEPKYAEVRQRLRDGELGEPASIYLKRSRQHSLFSTYKRTHTVYELMIHDIDQAIWLAGSRVRSVQAAGVSPTGSDVPEILWAQLLFENGVLAVLHSNWMTPDAAGIAIADYAEVIGTRGTAYFDTNLAGVQVWTEAGRETTDLSVHRAASGRVIGALKEQLNYVTQCLMYDREPTLTSFEDAIHGIEVADAIVRSAGEGRAVSLT